MPNLPYEPQAIKPVSKFALKYKDNKKKTCLIIYANFKCGITLLMHYC